MKTEVPIEQLLRWRLSRAEAEAPAAPRAARLLEVSRPWWERLPEQFDQMVQRLRAVQVQFGHAMAEVRQAEAGHRVAVLIVDASEQSETSARVLYFSVQDGHLRLRFQLEHVPEMAEDVEVTFVSEPAGRPLFYARATVSIEHEYRLEAEIPPELGDSWRRLKVTDRMPFRFLIRTGKTA